MSWWPVAWSEELRSKPLAYVVAGEDIVLFRSSQGEPFALEDRCPHRRVPLSLGTVTADGGLQCGYHGWTYEGRAGQCIKIPNLRDDERVSPRIKAISYPVAERGGVIFVEHGSSIIDVPDPEVGSALYSLSDQVDLSLGHESWMKIFLHSPVAALGVGRLGTDLVSHRLAQGSVVFDERVSESLVARTQCWAESGFSTIALMDPSSEKQKACIFVASSNIGDGNVRVRWKYIFTRSSVGLRYLPAKLIPWFAGPIKVDQELILLSAREPSARFNDWFEMSQLQCEGSAV